MDRNGVAMIFRWLGIALLTTAGTACSGRDRPPPFAERPESSGPLPDSADGRLLGGACPIAIPPTYEAQCGTLTVPEDRSGSSGSTATIELAVVVYEGKANSSVPVVYLEGGPGGHAIETVASAIEVFAPLLDEHDLVTFDQRGVGLSEPELSCPEIEDDPLLSNPETDEQLAALLDAVRACRARFSEAGIDPGGYTSRANAADVDDLRQALGYEKWHVFGVSYGTRLALDILRYHPNGVESAVLDSVLPTQVDFVSQSAVNAERAFEAIFAACEAHPVCVTAYPDLRGVLFELVGALDATPVEVMLPNGGSVQVTGDDVLTLLFLVAYSAEAIAYIPEMLFQFKDGDFSIFEAFSDATGDALVSRGMYLSVICSEYVAFSSLEALDAGNASVTPRLAQTFGDARIFDVCSAWNVPAVDPAERAAAQSDRPTLVLAGHFDPVTPPHWAELAATTLPNARLLTFEDQAHAVFAAPCGGDLLNAFFRDPASDPSAACPPTGRQIEFFVPPVRLLGGASFRATDIGPLVGDIPQEVLDGLRRRIH
jgi:pimeloyl-ACP methyl ester carboxylesterase